MNSFETLFRAGVGKGLTEWHLTQIMRKEKAWTISPGFCFSFFGFLWPNDNQFFRSVNRYPVLGSKTQLLQPFAAQNQLRYYTPAPPTYPVLGLNF